MKVKPSPFLVNGLIVRMKTKVARLLSIIVNPFLVHITLVLIILYESVDSTAEVVKWFLISIATSTVPIFITVLYLVTHKKVDNFFIKVRSQRDILYVLSSVLIGITCAVLFFLEAPVMLLALFVAIFIASLVFACVNRWWKISIHVASIAAGVTALVILYGSIAAWTALLIPIVAWSRVEMEHHSLAQVLIGGLLSSLILFLVFVFFKLV